ncbi:MAG: ATP-binding protein [Polyangiaceae bacterium]|nr:ATP-binding protein [Polyangiaceae bacterium]
MSAAYKEDGRTVSPNIDLREWGKYLGDATVAAAILDRLAMNAIRVDFDGPSFRQHVAAERVKKSNANRKPAKT